MDLVKEQTQNSSPTSVLEDLVRCWIKYVFCAFHESSLSPPAKVSFQDIKLMRILVSLSDIQF